MSDSSRHSIHAIAEDTYGTTPTSPAFKTLRHTGTSLGLTKESIVSEELREDRQITDMRHGTKQTGGDIMGELSYASYDDLLEAALGGTWAVKATKTATTLSAAASDDSFNDSGNGFITAGFQVGDEITVSGFTGNVANNRKYLITSVAAGKIVVTKSDGTVASNIVDDAAGESVTIVTSTFLLKAGTTRRSFSVLRKFADLSAGGFFVYTGQEVSKFDIAVAVNALLKITFGFVGKDQAAPANTAPSGTTYVTPNSNSPMDSFSGQLLVDDAVNAVVTEINLTLENGIEPRFVIGSATTIRPSIGRSNLTGTVTAFFEDTALLLNFINEVEATLEINLADLAGNSYKLYLPRVKWNGGQPDTQGQGSITLSCPIQALYDSIETSQITIHRIPAAA